MTDTATAAVTAATSSLQSDLLGVAGVGLGIGAVLLAVRKGWSLVKKFI
ncbi:MAG: hypothetical protein FWE71_01860 [Nocardioidaceae bacterium]|nr:hypothetical protein [Nocardioidaceae bacterium]MCL2613844.1 hypothetical protein [Nocardioidaceae bacterium]